MSPPCFVSPFIKKLLENFLLGSWSFFHFIFYIFPHTSFVSLSIAIFSYFLRQIIARDCRRKLPSCPFHLKTMDSLPLSQNKKPFPLLIQWNSIYGAHLPIRLSSQWKYIIFFKSVLTSDPKLSFHISKSPPLCGLLFSSQISLEQLQLSLLGTTLASPLDIICQICAFVWPPFVWNNYNYLCWGQLQLHL